MGVENPIYTVHYDCNSGLIKQAVDLYFNPGDKIADVTYGKGVFWKEVNQNKYNIVGSDLKTGIDFRNLPYTDNSFEHSVIDPPYARISNLNGMVACYNTTRFTTHEAIIELYREGMKELNRITKPKGYMFVKCQDEVCGCKQKWSHIEIHDIAIQELGLYAKDLFILVNTRNPKVIHKQQHARKTHSYLWVFQVN
jgi:ubiquinone/menaquinone biosynthesis C-methylase UbiE